MTIWYTAGCTHIWSWSWMHSLAICRSFKQTPYLRASIVTSVVKTGWNLFGCFLKNCPEIHICPPERCTQQTCFYFWQYFCSWRQTTTQMSLLYCQDSFYEDWAANFNKLIKLFTPKWALLQCLKHSTSTLSATKSQQKSQQKRRQSSRLTPKHTRVHTVLPLLLLPVYGKLTW